MSLTVTQYHAHCDVRGCLSSEIGTPQLLMTKGWSMVATYDGKRKPISLRDGLRSNSSGLKAYCSTYPIVCPECAEAGHYKTMQLPKVEA